MSKSNQNNLLISGDYPLIASPTLAKAYGVAAANFLQKLHYCLENNQGKVVNGKKYWFHSYEQWQITLGIYSISTIKRIVAKLKQAEILIVEKLAQNKWMQTNFYSINYKKLKSLIKLNRQPESSCQESVQSIDSIASTPSLEKPVQDTQSPIKGTSIQHAVQSLMTGSKIIEPLLKVAKESRSYSSLDHPKQLLVKGMNQPLYPHASKAILSHMELNYRHFYQALRQQHVDIHYDDQRIQLLLKYQKQIMRHIAYVKESFWGKARYDWYQLEQLSMDKYLKE